MSSLLAHVLPIAAAAAISPALLGVTLEVLATTGGERRRLVWAYLLGATAPLAGLGVVAVFAVPSELERGMAGRRGVVDVVEIVLGALLVLLAVVLVLRRPHGPGRDEPDRRSTPRRAGRWAALGVAMMVTNTSTLLLFAAGLREILAAHVSAGVAGVALVMLVLGGVAPIWVPLLADAVAPHTMQRVLAPLASLIRRHGTAIGSVVSAIAGLYLIGRGAGWW